jgi:4-amino-4-deoxy-L-arabinose transferase-like glycosyltransferase
VILAASVFCVSLQFLLSSSVLQLDIPVGFFILLAVFSFARGRHDERYFGLFWLSIGFGVMTKSVIGLLPLPIALIGAMMTNDHSYLRSRWFRFGVLLLLAVAVPWHLAETVLYGKAFWEQYVVYHLLTRWSTAIEGNGQPFLFYWQIIARQRLLFWVFAPSMIYVAYRGVKGDLDSALFGAACVVIFAFFTSSHTKLPGYILPIYPYMAGCVGVFFAAAFEALDPWAADGIAALIVIVCCFVGIRYMSYQQRVAHADQFAIDNRAVGAFLGNNYHSMDAYYLSESGTAPTIIYYADRIIYWLNFGAARPESSFILISTEPPPFYPAETVFKTPTEAVYLVQ